MSKIEEKNFNNIKGNSNILLRCLRPLDYDGLLCFFNVLEQFNIKRFFHPHAFNQVTARQICQYKGRDWYAALFAEDDALSMIAGYVILRGWDEGFNIPSLGVCVHPYCKELGLGRLMTSAAIATARLRQSPAIRVKVYPNNYQAIALYRSIGFQFDNNFENGQLIGLLKLKKKE